MVNIEVDGGEMIIEASSDGKTFTAKTLIKGSIPYVGVFNMPESGNMLDASDEMEKDFNSALEKAYPGQTKLW